MQKQATNTSAKPALTPLPFGVIQRKCDCGGSAGISGECDECQEKQLTINRYSTDRRAPSGLLPSRAEPAQSTMLSDSGAVARYGAGHHFGRLRVGAAALSGTGGGGAISQPGDRSEVEADRAAERVMRALSSPVFEEKQEAPTLSQTPPMIQRQLADESTSEAEAAPETTTEPETAAPEETPALVLIVEDDAQEIGPGQMRKSGFLDALLAAVCAAADAELARVGRSTEGCPYIERAFERYRTMSAGQLERGLRRYAPEAAGATTARDYIPAVSERVRRAVTVWAVTGQITGVPEELASELPGAGLLGAFGGLLSGIGGAVSGLVGGVGGIFFKARWGGAKDADPQAIQAQLGSGHSLGGGVKSRMESAFAHDFSRVRVHTDAKAAVISAGLNARAFTIGSDIAFGAGEYRPGTLIGDTLIAHELAHVVQQGDGGGSVAAMRSRGDDRGALEEDADQAALSAVASVWVGTQGGLQYLTRNARPRLRSGLSISRCSASVKPPEKPSTEKEEAAESLTLPDVSCSPSPVTLPGLTKIPGTNARNFGWTEPNDVAQAFTPLFDSENKTCQIGKIREGTLTFKNFVYVEPGTYPYGTQTRRDASCKGRDLPLRVEITSDMADKFKRGEIEHCNDLKRAFALSVARFNKAAREIEKEGTFPIKDKKSCDDQIMTKLASKMRFKDYESYRTARGCLFGKSKERDINGWHDVNVNLTSEIKVDPDCKRITHVLDPTHKNMMPELEKHSSKDLVKGCGE